MRYQMQKFTTGNAALGIDSEPVGPPVIVDSLEKALRSTGASHLFVSDVAKNAYALFRDEGGPDDNPSFGQYMWALRPAPATPAPSPRRKRKK